MATLVTLLIIAVVLVAIVGVSYEIVTGSLTGFWLLCSNALGGLFGILGEAVSELFKGD